MREVADEIVVVDSGSRDATPAIARDHGARVYVREWTNYADQKNFAADQATNSWLLSLDADEELSSALQTALLDWKKRAPEHPVYEFARRTWYLGQWIRHSGWYPDFQRRLFLRGQAKFAGIIHESLRFEGNPGRLPGDLLHYTVQSLAEHEANVDNYSTLAARQMFEAGKRNWRGGMWLGAPWSWFRSFLLRGGFLDGYRGVLIARMAGRTVRLKYRKLGQLVADSQNEGRNAT